MTHRVMVRRCMAMQHVYVWRRGSQWRGDVLRGGTRMAMRRECEDAAISNNGERGETLAYLAARPTTAHVHITYDDMGVQCVLISEMLSVVHATVVLLTNGM